MAVSAISRLPALLQRVTLRQLAWLAFTATLVTAGLITYGAWVRVSASGLGCPHWPLCTDASQNGKAALIESGHRVLATLDVVLVYATALLAWFKRREAAGPFVLLLVAAVLIIAQAVLGGVTVLLDLPGFVRLAHLALAMTVLGVLGAATSLLWLSGAGRLSSTPPSPKLLLLALAGAQLLVGAIAVKTELPGALRVLHLGLAALVWWTLVAFWVAAAATPRRS